MINLDAVKETHPYYLEDETPKEYEDRIVLLAREATIQNTRYYLNNHVASEFEETPLFKAITELLELVEDLVERRDI